MSLNIKNNEAYTLARELAQLTGQSMTAVVLEALRAQQRQIQNRQQKAARVRELTAIAQRCAVHIKQPAASVEHSDMLYDDAGMPA